MTPNKIILNILEAINPVLSKQQEGDLPFPIDFTFHLVLKRVKTNLESLHVLISDGIVKHNHAIGLISRNLLTDFITTGYIILLPHDKKVSEDKLYALHISDIKKVDSFLKIVHGAKYITDEELSEIQEKQNENRYKTIRDYCSNNKLAAFPPTAEIIKLFIDSKLTDAWSEEIKQCYQIWILYSKYEHLGLSSYEVTQYVSEEKTEANLYSILFNTTIMAASCMEILKEHDAMNKLMTHINQIKEKLYTQA